MVVVPIVPFNYKEIFQALKMAAPLFMIKASSRAVPDDVRPQEPGYNVVADEPKLSQKEQQINQSPKPGQSH